MMRHLVASGAAWALVLIVTGIPALIGAIRLMLWTFDVGNFVTGQGPAPWPF